MQVLLITVYHLLVIDVCSPFIENTISAPNSRRCSANAHLHKVCYHLNPNLAITAGSIYRVPSPQSPKNDLY